MNRICWGHSDGPPRELHGVSGANNGYNPNAKLYLRAIARDVADDGLPLSTDRSKERSFIIEETLDMNGCHLGA